MQVTQTRAWGVQRERGWAPSRVTKIEVAKAVNRKLSLTRGRIWYGRPW